jgi:N-acetylmuramoyl-L-alanine amidase
MARVFSALFAAICACLSIGMIANAQAPEPARSVARSVIVTESGGLVTVTVELSASAPARVFVLSGDRPRLVVDLTGARWRPVGLAAGAGTGAGAGFARGFRYAEHDTGVSRLVVDLDAPGVVDSQDEARLPQGGTRLIVRIRPERALPPRPALAPEGQPSPPAVRLAAQGAARRVIVIDAGHGGRDPGAIGAGGLREKDVTLDSALRLRAALEATGRYHVVLTRDADVFLPLPARLGLAREHGADLFISLHADASANPATRGASVYTISERGQSRGRQMAEAQDWDIDLGEAPTDDAFVEGILLDLAQRETTNLSGAFARTLIESLSPVTPLLRNTHRSAGFFVLLAPDVPAILLEMGFLTNLEDERRLGDPRERARLMQAVAHAVEAHFAAHPPLLLAER